LARATGTGTWLARPLEDTARFDILLRSWPVEQILKLSPGDYLDAGGASNAAIGDRLRALFDACVATGRELIVDVRSIESVVELYRLGVKPDWWQLAAPGGGEAQRCLDIVRSRDPHCRGLILRCADANDAFAAAPSASGFAVGESLYADVAERWLDGALDDAGAIEAIRERLYRMIERWEGRRNPSRTPTLEMNG
jgi:5-dehydro-2-deoxygluconokinase